MKRGIRIATLVLVVAGVFLCASVAYPQSGSAITPPPAAQPPSSQSPEDKRDNDIDFGSRESDTRVRLIIKAEKKAYEEHLARAKEAKQLADQVKEAYEQKHALSPEDQKKLERLEKLARRIRNDVGGSESDNDPRDLPTSRDQAMDSIARMAGELCDQVEKTPRRVVSASIIDQANKLISVIQFLKDTRH